VKEKKIISTNRNSHDHPLLTISSGLRAVFVGWLWFAAGVATFIVLSSPVPVASCHRQGN
jgi:hypothetical protein